MPESAQAWKRRAWLICAGNCSRISKARLSRWGAGNGMNFSHYPVAVTRVIAVEPEPYLRDLAIRAARRAPIEVTVLPGSAEQLPIPEDSADAAVLCLVLCSLRDRRPPWTS